MGNQKGYDVIVVGGGAAGMMAAGRAAERGRRVLLLEKNKELGKKLSITGGGRCNITNAEEDERTLLKHYGQAEQSLYSLFAQFGVADTFAFFKARGLPLVVQARQRAFPETERAPDVTRVMKQYCADHGVTIKTGSRVSKIRAQNGGITEVVAGHTSYDADTVILATGGVSHAETGATGDGFEWLRELGHKVAAPTPTIVPLATKESWVHELAGVSLSFMKITFYSRGEKAFSKKGKILFTHFGLSGPLILNSAAQVADLLHAGRVEAKIDVFPDTDHGALEKRILKAFDQHKNKTLRNVLSEFLPEGLAPALPLVLPDIDFSQRVHSVSKDARKQLMLTLKALPVTIEGLMGFDRAVVADGGVPLSEIDMRTCRSKKYENLYLTGDLLHINRPSGGYSLQLCWTTGYVAGSHA